jgi:uncharacterized protein (TIGR03663 family)
MTPASSSSRRKRPLRAPRQKVERELNLSFPSSAQWRYAAAAILLLAALCRVLYLTVKPLHHDEGVNGLFMAKLFRTGFYQYDPANYHGPTLYYFGLITTTLNSLFYGKAGLSTFAIRMVPGIFGIATVWLLLSTRRCLGALASLSAALLLTLSPAHLYFSRYFIHEVLFIFFTLALVMAALRYGETGKPRDLIWGATAAALLFATKETSVITFAVLLLAWLCGHSYLLLKRSKTPSSIAPPPASTALLPHSRGIRWLVIAVLLFIGINVLLYSSFFSNFPQGVYDSLRTYRYWVSTGANKYQSEWYTYFQWLWQQELSIFLLGVLGIVVALYQARHRFAIFTAFWAIGITIAYSLIPYKTPWLILNLLLPLAITAGYGVEQWARFAQTRRSTVMKLSVIATMAIALAWSAYQAIDLSFFRYDDSRIPYVYAHTTREFLSLVRQVESIESDNGHNQNLGIVVMSAEYWPLPWYLRDNPNVGYWGKYIDTTQPVIIALESQAAEIEQKLGTLYRQYGTYELRPGVRLVLYLRRDQQP